MNAPQPQQQLNPAQIACEFMTRADMKGGEVDIYAKTFNWLQSILAGEIAVVPADDLKESKEKIEALETEITELHTELDAAYTRLSGYDDIDVPVGEGGELAEVLIIDDDPAWLDPPAVELEAVESETSD